MTLGERINNTIEYYIKHVAKNRINKFREEQIKQIRIVVSLFASDENSLANKIKQILNEWFYNDWFWFLHNSRLKELLSTALDEYNAQNDNLIQDLQTKQDLLILEKRSLLAINEDLRNQIKKLSREIELLSKKNQNNINLENILLAKDLEISKLRQQNSLLVKELSSLKKNIASMLSHSASLGVVSR